MELLTTVVIFIGSIIILQLKSLTRWVRHLLQFMHEIKAEFYKEN